ncbi:MAG: hypothetical protein AAFR93_16405 [Pseudomonadota bacterium]
MDNAQLTWMITGALVAALLTGWVLHWIYTLLTRPQAPQTPDDAALMAAVEDAQQARTQAEARLSEVEGELTRKLSQTEAELAAAMDGLRNARMQTDALEQELEALREKT